MPSNPNIVQPSTPDKLTDFQRAAQEHITASGELGEDLIAAGMAANNTQPFTGPSQSFSPEDEREIRRAIVLDWESNFGNIDKQFATTTPQGTTFLSTRSKYATLEYALQGATAWFAQVYGTEYAAPFIQAYALTDPEQRAQTLEMLGRLAGMTPEGVQLRGRGPVGAGGVGAGVLTQEEFANVLADPSRIEELSYEKQRQVIDAAQVVQDKLGDMDPERFRSAVGIFATQNWQQVLSGQEVAMLSELTDNKDLTEPLAFGSSATAVGASPLDEVGIESFSADSEGGVFRLDTEWVRQHPVKATAVVQYLKESFPTAQVDIGERGIVGGFLDTLGAGVDAISSPFGAGMRWLEQAGTEGDKALQFLVDRDSDNLTVDQMRDRLTKERDGLLSRINSGGIAGNKLIEATEQIDAINRLLDEDVDLSFTQMLEDNINPRDVAFGFGDSFAYASGYRPGDPGFEGVKTVSGLVANFVFDPLMWGPNIMGGVALAARRPLSMAERLLIDSGQAVKISRSILTNKAYSAMAREAFDWIETPMGIAAGERLFAWKNGVLRAAATEGAGIDEVRGALMRLSNVPRELANGIAGATNVNDLRLFMAHAMSGGARGLDSANHARMFARMRTLEARVDARDAAIARHEELSDIGVTEAVPGDNVTNGRPEPWRNEENLDPDNAWDPALSNDVEYVRIEDLRRVETSPQPRDPAQVAELAADIGVNGFRAPLEVEVVADSGSVYIRNGNHRLAAAEQAGLEWVPVRTVESKGGFPEGVPLQEAIKQYAPKHERVLGDIFPDRVRTPTGGVPESGRPLTTDEVREIAQLPADIERLGATHVQDITELGFIRSMLEEKLAARLLDRPADFFTKSDLRQLEPIGPYEKALAWTAGLVDKGYGAFRLSNLWRSTGTEGPRLLKESLRDIVMPYVDDIDITVREVSANKLREFLDFMRVDSREADQLMGEFWRLRDATEGYEWLTKRFWPSWVDGSPLLNSVGRAELRKIWEGHLLSASGPDLLTIAKPGGIKQHEEVLSKVRMSAEGDQLPYGAPLWEADLLNGFALPTLPEIKDYITLTGKAAQRWAKYGGLRKQTLSFLNAATGLWKGAVLVGRGAALPARILIEQFGRMWGYGYASTVSHPGQWLSSVIKGWSEDGSIRRLAMMTDDEAFLLGSMAEDALAAAPATVRSRHVITITEDGFWNAMGSRLAAMNRSSSARALAAGDFENFLTTPHGRRMVAHWVGEGADEATAIGRVCQVFDQYMGTGPGADKVREAIRAGRITGPKGEVFKIGTSDSNDELARMYRTKEWTPGTRYINATDTMLMQPGVDVAKLLSGKGIRGGKGIRELYFKWIYSWPDKKLSRMPMWTQAFEKEFARLKNIGYSDILAARRAKFVAAQNVSNHMFRLGVHTSGENFLHNISPFFPAWRELSTTWLSKIPQRLGGGSRLLGGVFLSKRADLFINAGFQSGILEYDQDGKLLVDLGFTKFKLSTLAGILPVPSLDEGLNFVERVRSMAPSLGPIHSVILGTVSILSDNDVVDNIARNLLPYGVDVPFGPTAANKVWQALALGAGIEPTSQWIVPPWEQLVGADHYKYLANQAVKNAMRVVLSMGEHGNPPDITQYDTSTKAGKRQAAEAISEWMEPILRESEDRAAGQMLKQGLLSMILPWAQDYTPDAQKKVSAFFTFVNALPEDIMDEIQSPFIGAFRATYPEADPWFVATNIDLRKEVDQELTEAEAMFDYGQAVRDGEILTLDPKGWLVFYYGNNVKGHYLAQRSAIYQEFGDNPVEWLVSGPEKEAARAGLDEGYENFLAYQEDWAIRNHRQDLIYRNLDAVATNARNARDNHGRIPFSSLDNDRLFELKSLLGQLTDPNSDDVSGVLRDINGQIKYFTESDNPMLQTVATWYEDIAGPYYRDLNIIYKKIVETPKALQGPLYDQVRELADTQIPQRVDGFMMPTPEQVSFFNKTPEEREDWAIRKATTPPWWLTEFEREVLDFGDSEKVDEFAEQVNRIEREFNIMTHQMNTSSTEYINAKEAKDRLLMQIARDSGVEKIWESWHDPVYQQIEKAITINNESWNYITNIADGMAEVADAKDFSLGGSSSSGMYYQSWLTARIEQLRRVDSSFDELLNRLSDAITDDRGNPLVGPDLYMKVFFGVYWTDKAPDYLYTPRQLGSGEY